MNIADTCACGAVFLVSDRFAPSAQIQHRTWLDAHKPCREQKKPEERAPDIVE